MLEIEDKYTKSPTSWELAQFFPDCREMVGALIYELDGELKFYDEWISKEPFNENFKKVDSRYVRVQELKKFMKLTKPRVFSQQLDVQRAKSVPIRDLYDFNVSRETSKMIYAKCPFHDQKTGSFTIYKDSNSWFCYSCNVGGDSISFLQKLKGISFVQAVKELEGNKNDYNHIKQNKRKRPVCRWMGKVTQTPRKNTSR